ncbi:putative glutathione peroxidase 4 [Apium graveolens]|uniref:putative glutathione peroxidase 4 n=1 Tax=Apium graveolens TaxID=4045 RepID=UPI003D793964
MGAVSSVTAQSVHDFVVKDSRNQDVDLSIYKGKVLLIVNVAPKCGFANANYTELTELYHRYKDSDFVILAFPCNQFLHQAPGTGEELEHYACEKFKADYPVFQKVLVNGKNTAPIYKFLKANTRGFLGSTIKWNFTKFLIDKEGHVIQRYATTTFPLSIEGDIKKALEQS